MKPTTRTFRQTACSLIQRYWIGLAATALITLVLLLGSPAWAAPVASPANQTVPRPTATSSNDPVATATPLPDDGDEDSSDSDDSEESDAGGQAIEQGDINDIIFGQSETGQTETAEAAAGPDYTAVVSVATLNVREGPGTTFAVVGSLTTNEEVTVLFRNEDNSWWYICCISNTTTEGWISAQLAEPTFERAQSSGLIPVFGTEAAAAVIASAGQSAPESETTADAAPAANQAQGRLPVELTVSHSPDFVWQDQQVAFVFNISNPNDVALTDVEVSDDLPAQLEFISAEATAQGRVDQEPTVDGTVLVRIRWDTVPAGGTVSATVTTRISPDVPDGAVIDNLAAVRASNAAYTSSGVSVGMPPVSFPAYQ